MPSSRDIARLWLGNTAYALGQLVVIGLMARLAGPASVGVYALALSVTAPTFMLLSLSLRVVYVTDVAERHPFRDFLLLRLAGATTGLVLATAVGLVLGGTHGWLVFTFVGLAKALDSFGDIVAAAFQRENDLRLLANSLTLNGFLSGLAVAVALLLTEGIVIAAAASSAASLVASCIYPWLVYRRSFSPGHMKAGLPTTLRTPDALFDLARSAGPLGLAAGITSFTANVPQYALGAMVGTSALGLYAPFAYLLAGAATITSAVASASIRGLTVVYAEKYYDAFRVKLKRLDGLALMVAGLLFLIALVIGEPVSVALLGEEYAGMSHVLLLLMSASTIAALASFADAAISAMRAFSQQLLISGATALATGIAALSLVPLLGIPGAAVTAVVSPLIAFLAKTALVWRRLRVS